MAAENFYKFTDFRRLFNITDDELNAREITTIVGNNMKNKMKTLNSLKEKDPGKHKKYFDHAKLLLEAIRVDQENWSSGDLTDETDPGQVFEYQ